MTLIGESTISDSTKLAVVRECALLHRPVESVAGSYEVSVASAYRWIKNATLIDLAIEQTSTQLLRVELLAAEAVLRWMGRDEWTRQQSKGRSAQCGEDEKLAVLKSLRVARWLAKDLRRYSDAAQNVPVELMYAFIRDNMSDVPVSVACKAFRIARSGYYAWLRRTSETRHNEGERMRSLIAEAASELGESASYRRISEQLRSEGVICSRHRVKKLMERTLAPS